MFKEKMKKFWNKNKGIIITTGTLVGAGVCYLLLSKGTDELVEETFNEFTEEVIGDLELGDYECLVDGEVKPIFENDDETRIYDYAFANDQVKEEFREAGYTIVESK